jgi:hypothetical protein
MALRGPHTPVINSIILLGLVLRHAKPEYRLMTTLSLQHYYDAYQRVKNARDAELRLSSMRLTSLERFMGVVPGRLGGRLASERGMGFKRIEKCRQALAALDRRGWTRSFHQREFHDHFIRACARIFWKTESPGAFARDHQRILELNGWSSLSQEVLISTPRRYLTLKRERL